MDETRPDLTAQYRCFRCSDGCIHLVCGNTMINLSESQFLALFDAVSEMRMRIGPEKTIMRADLSRIM